jgi:hypothetical protein
VRIRSSSYGAGPERGVTVDRRGGRMVLGSRGENTGPPEQGRASRAHEASPRFSVWRARALGRHAPRPLLPPPRAARFDDPAVAHAARRAWAVPGRGSLAFAVRRRLARPRAVRRSRSPASGRGLVDRRRVRGALGELAGLSAAHAGAGRWSGGGRADRHPRCLRRGHRDARRHVRRAPCSASAPGTRIGLRPEPLSSLAPARRRAARGRA